VERSDTSALKMETIRFCETLASASESTRRPNPKEHNQNCHRRENFKCIILELNRVKFSRSGAENLLGFETLILQIHERISAVWISNYDICLIRIFILRFPSIRAYYIEHLLKLYFDSR
jgi:hypothetical protein